MVNTNLKRLIYGTYKLPKSYPEFAKILTSCSNLGIEWLDTAPIYNSGISESWIYNWQKTQNYKFKIATKAGKLYGKDKKLYVSNSLDNILSSIKKSLRRLKKSKLELLFLHDYDKGKTKEEIKEMIKSLLGTCLVQKVGLSNFPTELSEYFISYGNIGCLQVDCSASDKAAQALIAERNRIDCWFYRPFEKGYAVRGGDKKPESVVIDLLQKYPNCKIVFGASKIDQVDWLNKIKLS